MGSLHPGYVNLVFPQQGWREERRLGGCGCERMDGE